MVAGLNMETGVLGLYVVDLVVAAHNSKVAHDHVPVLYRSLVERHVLEVLMRPMPNPVE